MLQLRPTFSESWYRVAKLKVRMRPSAQISRQYYRGERWYVVRDPAGQQYHRLSDPAYAFVGLLDGTRTVEEAWNVVGGQLDDEAPTQPEVIQILSQLHAANMLESDVTPDSQVLLNRYGSFQKRRLQGRLMNLLFPRIPIWDPDRFLKTWMPVFDKIMSPIGALVWLIVIITAIALVAPRSAELTQAAKNSIDPSNWLWMWVVFVVIKFIHEMGHASACRRFGGECHEMGVMFLVFIPTPYVDASSAWAFPSRWARIFVGAAGMIFELFVAALCAVVWLNTNPATLINQLAYNAMFIASVTTILFNANPLLRYDGYYILSDFLEIPNLQKRSSDHLMGLIKRNVFRIKSNQPHPPLGQRLLLLAYGLVSTPYRIFVGLLIIVVVAYQVPVLGILMSMGGVVTWLVLPIFKTVKYLTIDPEMHRKRLKGWAFTLSLAAVVGLLIGMVPFWFAVRCEGIVEPAVRQVVYVKTPGFIEKLLVHDGQLVKAGDVLVEFRDETIVAQVAQIRAELKSAEVRARAAGMEDPSQQQIDLEEVASLKKSLAEKEVRRAELTIRATVDGTVVAPQAEELPGRYMQRGQQVMSVASMDQLEVRATIAQTEYELLDNNPQAKIQVILAGQVVPWGPNLPTLEGQSVVLVSDAQPSLPHPALGFQGGGEVAVDPSDPHGAKPTQPQYEMRFKLPPGAMDKLAGSTLLPGQRAYVRVSLPGRSIYWQLERKFLQMIQSHNQQNSTSKTM